MPFFRFNMNFRIARGAKAFLNLELGATRGRQAGALPDFLVIGAQKCGTTFLYRLLCEHPRVRPAANGEVQFFTDNFPRGVGWYRSCFKPSGGKITGEKSPYYLFHPLAPKRAAQTVPNAKLVAVLRNPVDRAYSHYHYTRKLGHEPLDSFEAAVEAEGERLRGARERILADERYSDHAYRHFSYLARGIYAEQLASWEEHFDRDKLLVLRSEDLFRQPRKTFRTVEAFLGLPPRRLEAPRKARNQRRYPPMAESTRRRLKECFEPHNRRLYGHLGADFGW